MKRPYHYFVASFSYLGADELHIPMFPNTDWDYGGDVRESQALHECEDALMERLEAAGLNVKHCYSWPDGTLLKYLRLSGPEAQCLVGDYVLARELPSQRCLALQGWDAQTLLKSALYAHVSKILEGCELVQVLSLSQASASDDPCKAYYQTLEDFFEGQIATAHCVRTYAV